jgi:hypothetical protein
VLFIVVTGSTETVTLEWDQLNIFWQPSALLVFLLGAVALLLAGIALGLFRRGARKGIQRRRELKRLRESDAERARAERDHAEQERAARARAVPPPTQTEDIAHDDRSASDRSASDRSGHEDHPRGDRGEERPVSPPDSGPAPQASGTSGSTSQDGSWYDDNPPARR